MNRDEQIDLVLRLRQADAISIDEVGRMLPDDLTIEEALALKNRTGLRPERIRQAIPKGLAKHLDDYA